MKKNKFSISLATLALTTLAGCSQPKYTEEDLRKKYEAPNTIIYGLDDWMSEDISVYTTYPGTLAKRKQKENESGIINYIFEFNLDNGQDLSLNVDLYTYFEFKEGDKVEITIKKTIFKDTGKIVFPPSFDIKKTEKEKVKKSLEKER